MRRSGSTCWRGRRGPSFGVGVPVGRGRRAEDFCRVRAPREAPRGVPAVEGLEREGPVDEDEVGVRMERGERGLEPRRVGVISAGERVDDERDGGVGDAEPPLRHLARQP